MRTIRLTDDEISALGEALDLAHGDQEHYLDAGYHKIDYGDDWEWAANHKAELFRALGRIGEKLGFRGEHERWEELATAVLETLEAGQSENDCTCDDRSWCGETHDSTCPLTGRRLTE